MEEIWQTRERSGIAPPMPNAISGTTFGGAGSLAFAFADSIQSPVISPISPASPLAW